MSRDKNLVILIGRLGQDPEVRYTAAGDAVANCTMATSESWTKDGSKQEKTTWHRLVLWRRVGEIAAQYCKKGSKIYVEGAISNREYEDNNGVKKHISEITVKELIMLDSPGGNQPPADGQASGGQPAPTTGNETGGGSADGFDDSSIPF